MFPHFRHSAFGGSLAVAALCLSAFQTAAQEPADTPQSPKAGEPALTDEGLVVGPLLLDLGIVLSVGYDDNVFATRNDRSGDGLLVLTPSGRIAWRGEKGSLAFYGSGDIARHDSEGDEDWEDFAVGTEGNAQINDRFGLFGGFEFARDHEPRESPDDVEGEEPTTYYRQDAYGGITANSGALRSRLGFTSRDYDFDDTSAAGGDINNDDRDRRETRIGGRVGYAVSNPHEIFLQGFADIRRYDQTPDDAGFDRDSTGFDAALGYRFQPSNRLDAEFFAGLLRQDYEDDTFDVVNAPDFGVRVRWRPDGATVVSGRIDRSVEETTLGGSSSYLSTIAGVSVERRLRRDLSVLGSLSWYDDDYQGGSREDEGWIAGLGGRWWFTRHGFVGLDYQYIGRDSNDPDDDYDDNQVFVRLGTRLSPGWAADSPEPGPIIAGNWLDGLYLGAMATHTALASELEGPRGPGGDQGTLTADFGDDGFGGGIFAGWGVPFGDWYLGVEAHADQSAAKWDHANEPDGRRFSISRETSFGGAVRFGRFLPGDALVFGSAGPVRTAFDLDYSGEGIDDSGTTWRTGWRFGIGADLPVERQLFLRLDYGFTSYRDHDFATDNVATSETQLRVGLGWRFGVPTKDKPVFERPSYDFTGPYMGIAVGQTTSIAELNGRRSQERFLEAQYADHGFNGTLLAGYGQTILGGLHLGAEVEAEASDTQWDLERDPTGRQVSIKRDMGYGASGRVGWVIEERALVYAKAGVVRSEFKTSYQTGGADLRQNDTQTGLRFGGGLELPVNDKLALRLEYTHTAYDDFEVELPSGTEGFDPSEDLFRAGVVWRF